MATNAPCYQQRGQSITVNAAFSAVPHDFGPSDSLLPHQGTLTGEAQTTEALSVPLGDNHNLVELLHAATTAAAQAIRTMDVDDQDLNKSSKSLGKRRRESSSPVSFVDDDGIKHVLVVHDPPTLKRVRTEDLNESQLPQCEKGSPATSGRSSSTSQELLGDARAAGVHSAAALFRRPSKEPSRKYTRPPMSKLFMSLQLTPENFVQLQSRAKAYMLDPAHPDRQECVGNRGKGDMDMVKLKLFNCVRDFLNSGVGDQFFGPHVELPAQDERLDAAHAVGENTLPPHSQRKLVWPTDGNLLISLVTPLLRRMVTNERQRMYAIQTRRGGRKKEDSVTRSQADRSSQLEEATAGAGALALADSSQDRYALRRDGPLAVPSRAHTHTQSPSRRLPLHQASTDSHSESPVPSLEHPYTPASSPNMLRLPTFEDELEPLTSAPADVEMSNLIPNIQQRSLPGPDDAKVCVQEIFILLSKDGRKLLPKYYTKVNDAASMQRFNWTRLNTRIESLVEEALSIYPELRGEAAPRGGEQSEQARDMAREALRGLAVAASEMQVGAIDTDTPNPGDSNPFSDDHAIPTQAPSAFNPLEPAFASPDPQPTTTTRPPCGHTDHPPTLMETDDNGPLGFRPIGSSPTARERLANSFAKMGPRERKWPFPKYKIKAMWQTGLKELEGPEDLKAVMMHVGLAVWAQGRLTIVVELL
ncbi:hypothetical protein M011DRAFT_9810 [Sporormia fimetaria CBS 119925]|uniref:Uncharacterized protein n=1 Tax=Sporormia fimetaria CBS 119925 TaxID=1340428 RepID=A0A6A6VPY4_9PLEO|nr:hypothetical protein M011DRAFT_9810 [Sporormia fimetaria CBS 119925]